MKQSWPLLPVYLDTFWTLFKVVHCVPQAFPPDQTIEPPNFKTISSYHDFAQLLLDHQRVKQEAYEFAKSKGWIRYPLKMKKELTELNYTAYPFLDELLKFHPDFHNDEKRMKKYFYSNIKRTGNRKALRQFRLRYNRERFSIMPTDAGRTKKKSSDKSEEIRNPLIGMKQKLVKMDRAIDYIDVQVLKEKMTTPNDFLDLKRRAEIIRKRIYAIENNGNTANYTSKTDRTLKSSVITLKPIKNRQLKVLRELFPDFFVDYVPTTASVRTEADVDTQAPGT